MLNQRLHNAFRRPSVPSVGQGGVFPFAVQQSVEGVGEGDGVFADQFVGADAPGLGVFGVGVEGDAGHVEEGGFFGDVARVGDDALRLVDEEAEVQVALRGEDVQVGHLDVQRLDGALHVGVYGGYDGHVGGFRGKRLHQCGEHGALLQQVVAVEGEQQVAALVQAEGGEPERLLEAVAVVAYGVDEDVAHVVDVFGYHAFLVEVAVGHHAGGEEVVGDGVDDGAVHLARHIHVERAGTGYDVCHLQPSLLGDDGAAHGGGHVVHHEHRLGGMLVQLLLEGKHDGGCHLRVVASADAEVGIGAAHGEVGEERGVQRGVVLSSGVYDAVGDVLPRFPGGVHGAAQGGYLHEVGACARYDGYFHCHC